VILWCRIHGFAFGVALRLVATFVFPRRPDFLKRFAANCVISSLSWIASSAIPLVAQGSSGAIEVPGTPVVLSYSAVQSGKPVKIGPDKLITLHVQLSAKDGKAAGSKYKLDSFDARMPAHNHGMVTKPIVKKVSDSEFSVEGVKLHMPGKWVFDFVVSGNSVKVPLDVKIKD
jgi:hypothetical protein